MESKYICLSKSKVASALVIIGLLGGCGDSSKNGVTRFDEAQKHYKQRDFASAVIELKNVLKEERNNIAARKLLGNAYFEQGKYVEAEKELERAYRFDKSDSQAYFSYAKVLLQQRSFEELNTILKAKRAWTARESAKVQSLRLRLLVAQGDQQGAEKLISSKEFEKLDNSEALYARALYYVRDERVELAQELINTLLERIPNHVDGRITNGDLSFSRKDYQGALLQYQQAKAFNSARKAIDVKLVKAMVALNQFVEAEVILDQLLKQSEVFHQANYYYAFIKLAQKDYDTALVFANKVLSLLPNHLESQYIAAQSAFFLKRYELSHRYSLRLANKFPNNSDILKLLAANQLTLQDYEAAVTTLARLPDEHISKKDASLLIEAARGLKGEQNLAVKKALLLKAEKAAPEGDSSKWGLAFVAFSEGKGDEGNSYLLKALEQKPDSPTVKAALVSSYLRENKLDKAQALITDLRSSHPDDPNGHTLQGLLYIRQDKQELAAVSFDKALTINPNDINANSNLASLAILGDKLDVAKQHYQNILDKHPRNLKALQQMWLLEKKLGQTNESRHWLQKIVREQPQDVAMNVALAQQYIVDKNYNEVIKLLKPFEQDSSETLIVRLLTGQAYYLSNQPKEALSQFTRSKSIDPADPASRYWSALTYEKLNDAQKALSAANSALSLMPDDKVTQTLMLRLLINTNNLDDAKPLLDKLVVSHGNDTEIQEYRAKYSLLNGKIEQAVSQYQQLFKRKKTNSILVQYATALTQNNQRTLAVEKLEAWIRDYPEDALVLSVLSNEYLFQEKYALAKQHFSTIARLQPSNALAHNNLAWLLYKAGDLSLAQTHADKALQLAPKSAQISDTLGQILLAKGDYKKSRELLKLASKKMPDSLETKYHLARATALDGDKLAAMSLLQQILALKSRRSPSDLIVRRDSESLLKELQ